MGAGRARPLQLPSPLPRGETEAQAWLCPQVIDAISRAVVQTPGCVLLDVDAGPSTNRTVYTFVGSPEDVVEGALNAARVAHQLIDMGRHRGEGPSARGRPRPQDSPRAWGHRAGWRLVGPCPHFRGPWSGWQRGDRTLCRPWAGVGDTARSVNSPQTKHVLWEAGSKVGGHTGSWSKGQVLWTPTEGEGIHKRSQLVKRDGGLSQRNCLGGGGRGGRHLTRSGTRVLRRTLCKAAG